MTRYEQGFMNKCAEYGVDGRVLLEKLAVGTPRISGAAGTYYEGDPSKAKATLNDVMRQKRRGVKVAPQYIDLLRRMSTQHPQA